LVEQVWQLGLLLFLVPSTSFVGHDSSYQILISSGVMLTKLFTGGGRDDDDDGWGVDISTGGS
jgi:hypothetical protein